MENLLVHLHWIFVKKSSFFITKNIGILLLWLASSGSLDCFYALIKIYNFIKIMFFQVAFLDFQNLQEWGRRINDTYTKMNGISEVRPSIFVRAPGLKNQKSGTKHTIVFFLAFLDSSNPLERRHEQWHPATMKKFFLYAPDAILQFIDIIFHLTHLP